MSSLFVFLILWAFNACVGGFLKKYFCMSFAFFSSDKEFAAINQRLVEKGVIDR